MRTLHNVKNFIQSKVFIIPLAMKHFESERQHVAYIVMQNEAYS
jgi:hypothetical protein